MKNFILIVLMCSMQHIMLGQTILEGTVTDINSEEGLISARVGLKKAGKLLHGTITDFYGNYIFSNIDSGTYDIEIFYIGYQTEKGQEFRCYSIK